MKTIKTSIDFYAIQARKLGYSAEFITHKTPRKLLISNGEKSCVVDSLVSGFYPTVAIWQRAICKNKTFSQILLTHTNYSTIPTQMFDPRECEAEEIVKYINEQKHTYPLIIKPNSGEQGMGVMYIDSEESLLSTIELLKSKNQVFLVQPILEGTEYRILIVNGVVRVIHSKDHRKINGDDTKTIEQLLSEIEEELKDEQIINKELAERGYSRKTILPKGESIRCHITKISPPFNGQYYESENIPEVVKNWGAQLAKDISCHTLGVDVFIPTSLEDTSAYTIIEVNSNPSFFHFHSTFNDTKLAENIVSDALSAYFNS